MTHYLIRQPANGPATVSTDECETIATFRQGHCGAIALANFILGCVYEGDTYELIETPATEMVL